MKWPAPTVSMRRVVVVDETSIYLDMANRYARAPRGQRRNFGKNITLLAGLRLDGMCAPFVVEGVVNTAVFETYVARVLSPPLYLLYSLYSPPHLPHVGQLRQLSAHLFRHSRSTPSPLLIQSNKCTIAGCVLSTHIRHILHDLAY